MSNEEFDSRNWGLDEIDEIGVDKVQESNIQLKHNLVGQVPQNISDDLNYEFFTVDDCFHNLPFQGREHQDVYIYQRPMNTSIKDIKKAVAEAFISEEDTEIHRMSTSWVTVKPKVVGRFPNYRIEAPNAEDMSKERKVGLYSDR